MTIVVWDGRYVVSDSLAIRGSLRCENEPKLRAVDGKVYAVIGRAAMFDPLVEWHRNGADPEKFPKASPEDKATDFLVFDGDQCSMYSVDLPYPDRMYGPTAWGCGRDFAIGAMAAGKNAVQAAEIAISKDYNLGGPIQVIDLNSLEEIKPIPPESLAEMRQLAKEVDLGNAIRLLEEAGYDVRHPDGEDCGFGRCGICNAFLVDDFGCRECKDRSAA